MIRTTRLAILAAATSMIAVPALAQTAPRVGPPMTFTATHWTDPATGCSYARAQAQGYAPTWHLILNGADFGLTDAYRGCAVWLPSS